ncbi:MAG: hypothetical protein P8080_04230 [Gammaproteobacteria bacterium]
MTSREGAGRRVLVLAGVALVALAAWFAPLDDRAEASLAAGTARAFVTFATARGLNAAISVAQGTELSGGVGVTATFSVGEVLDPLNDLVEQFADLMLAATVSFGVQQVLLSMGQHESLKLVLTLLLGAWALWYARGAGTPRWLGNLVILALLARFAVPLSVLGSDQVFTHFLEDRYVASEAAMAEVSSELEAMNDAMASPAEAPGEEGDGGWLEGLQDYVGDKIDSTLQWLDLRARFAELKASLGATAEHVVDLVVVFLLQTLIVPLLILWVLYSVARGLVSGAASGSRQ